MGEDDVVARIEAFRGDLHYFGGVVAVTIATCRNDRKLVFDEIGSRTREGNERVRGERGGTYIARLVLFVRPNDECDGESRPLLNDCNRR